MNKCIAPLVLAIIVIAGCKQGHNTPNIYSVADSVKWIQDSIQNVNDSIKSKNDRLYKAKTKIDSLSELKTWYKTAAGRLQRKHPTWAREDCKAVIKGLIWVGMDIKMLEYERGKPDVINPSDYGRGTQYQGCWHANNPSCFYWDESGIISAYN